MIFEYLYEILDEPSAIEMQEKMKTPYRIGGVMLCINFVMGADATLDVRSIEILYAVSTEDDIPIYLTKAQKFIIGDYLDDNVIEAECYAESVICNKAWGDEV